MTTTLRNMSILALSTFCILSLVAGDVVAQNSCGECQRITASSGDEYDYFGTSVATNTAWVFVGAPNHDYGASNAGAVFAYSLVGGVWTEQQRIQASDVTADAKFGTAIEIVNGRLFVGAPAANTGVASGSGAVYVFEYISSSWQQTHKISPPTASSGEAADDFGIAISVSNTNRLVVGSPLAKSASTVVGRAYSYIYNPGLSPPTTESWDYNVSFTGTGGNFGGGVATEGDVVAVGAAEVDSSQGEATIYKYNSSLGTWPNTTVTLPYRSQSGAFFGKSIVIESGVVFIAAYGFDDRGTRTGAIFTFELGGGSWGSTGQIVPYDIQPNDELGRSDTSMAIIGTRLIAGARGVSNKGAVYLWKRHPATGRWGEIAKFVASGGSTNDFFGTAVALHGQTIVIGAYTDDESGNVDQGSTYIFRAQDCIDRDCPTDWNNDGEVNSTDTSDYINDWFANQGTCP